MASDTINGFKASTVSCRKPKHKKKLAADSGSSASSNNCRSATKNGFKLFRDTKRIRAGSTTTWRSVGPRDVDALALPLGMSIAAVVAQVLERKNASGEKISDDYLSGLCILAVRESLANVFGDKFDSFVTNFEKSFRSTLMTLSLIKESSQNVEETHQRARFREGSCSVASTPLSLDRQEDSACPDDNNERFESFFFRTRNEGSYLTREQMEDNNAQMDLMNRQLVNSLHDLQIKQQLPGAYTIMTPSNPSINQLSMPSTMEKSVMEQTRSNDLKTFEIGLIMKKLQLKERQLSLNSDSNFLERWKLSMGFSKASFKVEKFKTQLRDTREMELLRKCLDFLVSGLIIMLFALAYGTYVYSHRRITEITESCSPMESKPWWMPTSMSTFSSGLQILRCQIQVLSRMLFGIILIGAITFLLIQRSSIAHQTMPVTFIVLLLSVVCGFSGKFCVDTLGGSGNHWLIYWEAICLLHFFSNTFNSTLLVALNGPVTAVERLEDKTIIPYWARRVIFYSVLLSLPLLCGLMPFASFWEWINHFSSLAVDFNYDFHR